MSNLTIRKSEQRVSGIVNTGAKNHNASVSISLPPPIVRNSEKALTFKKLIARSNSWTTNPVL